MKLILATLAAALTLGALPAQAQATSPFSFNVSLTSDYRYRGISQSRLKPALQGGIDYAHSSGFYLGVWASSIKWIKDAGGDADVEVDVYAGYKTEIAPGLTMDVGLLTYNYPSEDLAVSADTREIYGALSYGPVTLKYSHATSNLFGFADSKKSGYLEIAGTFDLGGGFTLTPHVGHQKVKGSANDPYTYTDYSLTLNKDYGGFTFGVAAVGTDTDAYIGGKGKDLGKDGALLSIKKVF